MRLHPTKQSRLQTLHSLSHPIEISHKTSRLDQNHLHSWHVTAFECKLSTYFFSKCGVHLSC